MSQKRVLYLTLVAALGLSAQSSLRAAQAAAAMQIPSGTRVTVRLIDAIKADNTAPGSTFRGSVADPVVVHGRVVVPTGADAVLQVVQVHRQGALKGHDELTLTLRDVTVNGVPRKVSTSYAEFRGKSKKTGRNALIGGGAGGLIGGIAGGFKGFGIGSLIGAGGGTVFSLVKGKHLTVPAETRLDFILQSPVSIR